MRTWHPRTDERSRRRGGRLRVGLLCTGQGAQYPGMTRRSYRACPPYRAHLTRAAAAVDTTFAAPDGLLTIMFRDGDVIDHHRVRPTGAVRGVVRASARRCSTSVSNRRSSIGHSVGEFAAAVLAEVLTLDEAADSWSPAAR